jgi:NAD(P)-dependent dehydrogenase (short-subunit alcohol dehydrogenase family)
LLLFPKRSDCFPFKETSMPNKGFSLTGKRVVIIGGTSGIGFAIAELAQETGAQVVVASSNPANVEAAVKRLPGATGNILNMRDAASIGQFFETAGAFDHLAITSGDWNASMFAPLQSLDLSAARDGLEIRFWGALTAARHAAATIAPNGSITLTSGMLAHRPQKASPLATAVGGAIEHMARGLAVELAPVRVNAVCPGLVLTQAVQHMPAERVQSFVRALPIARAASPAEAAKAYVYLMLNDYITGQILPVDGGGMIV